MNSIMVQMAKDADWTMRALHLACTLARMTGSTIIALRLIPVPHPAYLGTPFGNMPLNDDEHNQLSECVATAEDYGLELSLFAIQCVTELDAIAQAAELLNASVVFAHVPESRIAYWRRFRCWKLERQFEGEHRQLITLDKPVDLMNWAGSLNPEIAQSLDHI